MRVTVMSGYVLGEIGTAKSVYHPRHVLSRRAAQLGRLDDASLRQPRATLIESLKQLTKFQEHAATLAADGKVTPVEGQRLGNLSETVRRCIDRVRGSRER